MKQQELAMLRGGGERNRVRPCSTVMRVRCEWPCTLLVRREVTGRALLLRAGGEGVLVCVY